MFDLLTSTHEWGLGPLVAAGGVPPLVQDLGICLVAAVAFAAACERLRLPHAIGFVAAGLLVGPPVLGAVHSPEDIQVMADLGIVMLLFLLGIELDVVELARRGRGLLAVGLLQVPLSVLLGLVAWGGLAAAWGWPATSDGVFYLALVGGFSSTLLVVRALEQHGCMGTTLGTMCVGILLAQDLWALMILAVQPSRGASFIALLAPLLGTALVAASALGLGRPLMARVIRRFDANPDLLALSALAWCLSCAILAEELLPIVTYLGSSFPLSSGAGLGAFVAGLTIASLPQARQLIERLVSLRDFFVVFFFVSLGMSIPWPVGETAIVAAGLLAVVVLLTRLAVMLPLLRVSGARRVIARGVTGQMAQISEFGLVIVYLGRDLGHVTDDVVTVVVLGFVITASLSPAVARVGLGRTEGGAPSLTSEFSMGRGGVSGSTGTAVAAKPLDEDGDLDSSRWSLASLPASEPGPADTDLSRAARRRARPGGGAYLARDHSGTRAHPLSHLGPAEGRDTLRGDRRRPGSERGAQPGCRAAATARP